jgi:hypothetical protein
MSMANTEAAIGRDLRRLFDGGAVAGLTDAQLLDRVARRGEAAEDAFQAILTRHGSAVLACCRRVSGDSAAAEDATRRPAGRGPVGPGSHDPNPRPTGGRPPGRPP